MLCIESIRISHAQYPSGNCHVSSKFVSFFSPPSKESKHLSKNSRFSRLATGYFLHHSSIFIRANRYYFDRDADHVDCRPFCDFLSLSLSYPTRSVFQWASSTWLHIFWVERSEKLHGSDGRQRKQLTRKGERKGEEISRGKKPRFFRSVERISIDSGIKRDLALQLITPDSRKSRRGTRFLSLEREIRHENSIWKVSARW